jgi:hypothetical protein
MTALPAPLHPGATATELVPGDPDQLELLVARCRTLADGLGGAAARVRAVDAGEWRGPAGDAFRAAVDLEPGRFEDAAAAFAATAAAVRGYVGVLREEQATARAAVDLYRQARAASAAWNQQVAEYADDARRAEQGAHPQRALDALVRPPAYDPGADDLARAEAMLADARDRVAAAGAAAARRVAEAWRRAPAEPHWWQKAGHFVAEIGRGAWETTESTAVLAWDLSPVRMVADPDGWTSTVEQLGRGVVYGAQHPVALGKALIDWDTWRTSPGRAIGHLLPDLALALLSGGAAEAARGAEAAEDVADLASTFGRLDRLGGSGERLTFLRRARNTLRGERLPEPEPGAATPAGRAAAYQTDPAYGGVDRWTEAVLRKGDVVGAGSVAASPHLRFSGFAVPESEVTAASGSARTLFEGLQVRPWNGTYRDQVTMLRATRDVRVAVSYALANPQYGAGGLRQVFVHAMHEHLDEGTLEIVERIELADTVSGLGAPAGAP